MNKNNKKIFSTWFTFLFMCICVCAIGFGMQANAEEKLTTDLGFLYHCKLDELLEWNSNSGYFDEAQAAEMKAYMDTYITKSEKDEYEKARRIHQWIVDNVTYSYEYNYLNPYDVFTKKSAVCGGYSNLYKAMLNLADIPAVLVSGMTSNGAHVWNAVYANGRWFYSDATWGTPYFDPGADNFIKDHYAQRVEYVSVETKDGLLIGYDTGIAVVGAAEGVTEVKVPDYFEEYCVTSISFQLFNEAYGIKKLEIGAYVNAIDTGMRCLTLEEIKVSENNYVYASRDGVLFSKDLKQMFTYPANKKSESFTLPKETISFDIKQAFENQYLVNLEVEEGNTAFASYEGALYDASCKELLMVPLGKTDVYVPADATISGTAFANADTSKMTIYSEEGSPAHQYALANGIAFKTEKEPEEVKNVVTDIFKDVAAGKWYVPYVQYVYDNGLMSGNDGMFKTLDKVTRAQLVMTLYRLAGEPEITDYRACKELSDVESGKWYTDAICWAYNTGITTGNTTTKMFNVSSPVTREQIAAFFYRYAKNQGMDTSAKGDLSTMLNADQVKSYSLEAMQWAVGEGLITGSDVIDTNGKPAKDLAPQSSASRAQLAAILQRFCEN